MKKIIGFCVALLVVASCQSQKSEKKENEVMEAENSTLLIGTYTRKEGHVDGQGEGVYVYEMNNNTGELSYVSTSDAIISPSYVAIHPNGEYVYAANEYHGGDEEFARVSALKYDKELRTLTFLNEQPSLGQYPCFVTVDNSGMFVMAANYDGGSVVLFPIGEEGMLEEASSYKKHEGGSEHPRQEAPHAHQIVQDPSSGKVYSVDLGANKIYEYVLDSLSLTLNEEHVYEVSPAQMGPRHMAFHPTEPLAYLLGELSGTIEVIDLSSDEKFSKSIQSVSTLAEGETRDAASGAIKVASSGKFLYATNRGEINEVVVYAIDGEGKLSLVQHQSTFGLVPRDIEISPSGKFLLAANQDSNTIVTFKINQQNGQLEETGLVAEVPSPVCIKFF